MRWLLWLAPLAAGLGALALGQDASWDLRNYHFYVPFAFLHDRMGQDVAVAHVATYYNPLLHLPFYWAVVHLSPRLVGFFAGAAAGVNVWIVYAIARRLGAPASGASASGVLRQGGSARWFAAVLAVVGFCGAMNLSELGTSFGDNLLSIPVLAAVWVVLRGRERLASPGAAGAGIAMAAGSLAGLAAGLKLPFAVFALAGCAALLALRLPPARRLGLATAFGLGVLAGMALTGGFWIHEMWQRFGNPLFPYFNDVFHSPWASAGSYRHEAFIPSGLLEWLVFPFDFALDPLQVAEVPFRDLRFPVLYLLLVALAARALWRRFAGDAATAAGAGVKSDDRLSYLAWFAAISFVVWAGLFGVSRYVVALELLAPTIAWFASVALVPAVGARPWIAMVAGLALLSAGQRADWERRPWSDDYFGVVPPSVPAGPPAMVLMAGREPSGYLVPSMPASTRFLRIQGYFTGPSDAPNATDLAMRAAIAAHRGPLFLLYREYEDGSALPAARQYGFRIEPDACQRLLPAVEPDQEHPFLFCPLRPL